MAGGIHGVRGKGFFMRCRCLFILSFLSILLLMVVATSSTSSVAAAAGIYAEDVVCGTTIPEDSQWIVSPVWSIRWNRLVSVSSQADTADAELRLGKVSVSKDIDNIVRSEAGMNPRSVVLFELNPDLSAVNECEYYWNPLKVAMHGTEITVARVMAIGRRSSDPLCQQPMTVELTLQYDKSVSHVLQVDGGPGVAQSVGFSTRHLHWPVVFQVSSSCPVYLLLLTNRQGSIHEWYAWIPATVYTGVVLLLIATVMALRRALSPGIISITITFLFVGYLGSCIGLVLEVVVWQNSLCRMFPFPGSVTLYCCLPFFYVLMFLLVLLQNRHYDILVHAMLHLLVYGLNCALCCGYWVIGDVLLGSLTLVQFLLSNLFLSAVYSYFAIILGRSNLRVEPVANMMGFLWFAPLTPFVPCVLMYHDLCTIKKGNGQIHSTLASVARESVMMYSALTSLPLLFLQNVWGIALLATATSYHMPFVILLFPALLFFILHLIISVQQYIQIQGRWIHCMNVARRNRCFSFFYNWCIMWTSLERCISAAHRQAAVGPEGISGGLSTRVETSNDCVDRALPDASAWQAHEANGNELPYLCSSTTATGNEDGRRKDDYWPPSVSI